MQRIRSTFAERTTFIFNSQPLSDVKFVRFQSRRTEVKVRRWSQFTSLCVQSAVLFYGQMAETADSIELPDWLTVTVTVIYTSELIPCSTICVHSATRHNIHMYPYFLFAAIHHLNRPRLSPVRPRSSVGRVAVDLIRRSWVRFPPRSKDFFFTSCGSLIPFTRANA